MEKAYKNSVKTKFYEEIKELIKDESKLKKYNIDLLIPSRLIMSKTLSNDNRYVVFVTNHNFICKYGIDGNVFIIEIQIKDPQERVLYKMNILVRDNNSKDNIPTKSIIDSNDVIDITSEVLYDNIVELMDLCNIKKANDDIERKYKRMMDVLGQLND